MTTTKQKFAAAAAVATALSATAVQPAEAALFQLDVYGTMGSMIDPAVALYAPTGTPIHAQFIIDDGLTDTDPLLSADNFYLTPGVVDAGGFQASPAGASTLRQGNYSVGSVKDQALFTSYFAPADRPPNYNTIIFYLHFDSYQHDMLPLDNTVMDLSKLDEAESLTGRINVTGRYPNGGAFLGAGYFENLSYTLDRIDETNGQVAEPNSLALIGLGLVGMAGAVGLRRREDKKDAPPVPKLG